MHPLNVPSHRSILRLFGVLLALWLFLPGQARADACTATMTDIVFTNVNPIAGSDYYASGTLTVNCTYTVGSGGLLGVILPNVSVCATLGGTSSTRTMLNGSNTLPFNLYTSSTYAASTIWGSGTSGTTAVGGNVTALLNTGTASGTFTIYGKIPGSTLSAVKTSGNANTTYTADFSGLGTLHYAFGTLVDAGCTNGSSTTFAFQARATVVNDCLITAGQLAFGTASVLNAAVRNSTTIGVQCTSGSAYQVSLNAGNNASGSVRRMKKTSTGEMVIYQLSNTLDGANWGDGTTGQPVGGTGSGAVQSLPLYGRVGAQTTPSPGDYKDTVTATLYF